MQMQKFGKRKCGFLGCVVFCFCFGSIFLDWCYAFLASLFWFVALAFRYDLPILSSKSEPEFSFRIFEYFKTFSCQFHTSFILDFSLWKLLFMNFHPSMFKQSTLARANVKLCYSPICDHALPSMIITGTKMSTNQSSGPICPNNPELAMKPIARAADSFFWNWFQTNLLYSSRSSKRAKVITWEAYGWELSSAFS